MAKGDKGKGQRPAGQPKHGVVTDPRFARMHHDPRFKKFPKNTSKVEIDDRFKGMFEDADFQGVSVVDKRGRTVAPARRKGQDLKRYYRLKDEEEWQQDSAQQQDGAETVIPPTPAAKQPRKAAPAQPSHTSSDTDDAEADEEHRRWARARGLVDSGSSSDPESSSDEAQEEEPHGLDSADEALDADEWGVGALAANPEEQIPVSNPTHRLALVDLDWSQLRAVDILAALRSFCPGGGRVERVTVYPSDYGLEQMAAEREAGPRAVLRAAEALADDEVGTQKKRGRKRAGKKQAGGAAVDDMLLASDNDDDDDDTDDGNDDDNNDGAMDEDDASDDDVDAQVAAAMGDLSGSEDDLAQESASEGDDDEGPVVGGPPDDDEQDTRTPEEKRVAARIRMYERSKLRWYYAIAECDCNGTALRLYEECDGLEFQRSACKFDLRFVPDEQRFDGRQVRDSAADVPHDYEPPVFHTRALQHTEVKLTWDEDDVHRKRVLGRRPAADELKDDDFKAYLASESDSEGEDAPEQVQDRYRALLRAGTDERRAGGKGWGAAAAASDDDDEGEPAAAVAEDKAMEMEVTFAPGLDSLGKKILDKACRAKGGEGETVWEAYMRRKREKRRLAKEMGRARADSDTSDDDGEGEEPAAPSADPFDDPFFNDDEAGEAVASDTEELPATSKKEKSGGKKKKKGEDKHAEHDAREAAQLELLLMDDAALTHMAKTGNTLLAHAAAQPAAEDVPGKQGKASRAAKARAKKEAKKREREQGSDDEDLAGGNDFAVNLDDARFSAMLTSPEFALDPTDPRYKQATAVVEGVRKRRKRGDDDVAPVPKSTKPVASAAKGDLQMMVAKLKTKQSKKTLKKKA